jgi:hypothetical protein
MSNPHMTYMQPLSRRAFLARSAGGIAATALTSLLSPEMLLGAAPTTVPGTLGVTHFAPKAKRIIYLCQSGAPSQIELFDYNLTWTSCGGRSCRERFAWASGLPG